MENVDEEFTALLWERPHHWFSQINAGIRVQNQICFALYQTFCLTYGYEIGVFDLASKEKRIIVKNIIDDKTTKPTEYLMWGQHEDDWKVLSPIYIREKNKYLQTLMK